MDREMQRVEMEAQAEMITGMLQICREKTLKKNHSGDDMSADERRQF